MNAFHYDGDAKHVADAIAVHDGHDQRITPTMVRRCRPIVDLSQTISQAATRSDRAEASGILATAKKHILTLQIAITAAEEMLAEAFAALGPVAEDRPKP